MKVYSPADMAAMLQLKPATLRKYSKLLEQYGYKIERNSQGHRYYQDRDIITLRNIISGNNSDVTLEQAIQNVVYLNGDSNVTNATNSDDAANDSDIQELKNMIHKQNELTQKQSEMIYKQNETIKELSRRLDQQQEYIKQSIEQRDRNLLDNMNQMLESQKQIAAENQEENNEKKQESFFKRIFKRGQQ